MAKAARAALFVVPLRRTTLLCITAIAAGSAISARAIAQVVGEVRGRVTDAATARPIANGRVEIAGRSESVRSTGDGAFLIRALEPGTYSVTVHALGYAPVTQEIDISNGRVATLDVRLVAQAALLNDVYVRAARDTSALNTTVFNRTTIEQSGLRDLGELLQTVPGVMITQAGGVGQSGQISIRGSSANQVLVLIDGVPLNSAISGSADLSQVSLETVGKITIRTGAQSARYGARAMAGVIEIATRQPQHDASAYLRTGALGEHNASATVGNTVRIQRTNFGAFAGTDYRTVKGNFSYELPAVRGGGRATRINADATSKQLFGGISSDGGFGVASIRGTWQRTERGLAGTIVQPSSTGRQSNSRINVGGSAQGIARQVAWTFAADLTNEASTFIDRSPPFGQAFDDTLSANGVTASARATIGQHSASASGGAELRTLDITSTMLAPTAPHWQQLLGAWGNARFAREFSSALRMDVDLSGRIDQNSLSDDAVFSPKGTMRVSHGAWSSSLSLGAGYAPPTLSDQFFHEGVQVRANPGLRPERTRQDIEGRLALRESSIARLTISGDAAAYRSNIDGMILWFPDFRFIWSPTNYDVKRSGWELNGKLGAPPAHLELFGALNRTDVTYTGGILNGQVAYRPRNSASIKLSFAPRAFRVDITNRHVGTRRTVTGSALNSLTPYSMTDARASVSFVFHIWTFNPAVGIENVLNRSAAMLVDYPFPPRTWNVSLRVRRSTSQPS